MNDFTYSTVYYANTPETILFLGDMLDDSEKAGETFSIGNIRPRGDSFILPFNPQIVWTKDFDNSADAMAKSFFPHKQKLLAFQSHPTNGKTVTKIFEFVPMRALSVDAKTSFVSVDTILEATEKVDLKKIVLHQMNPSCFKSATFVRKPTATESDANKSTFTAEQLKKENISCQSDRFYQLELHYKDNIVTQAVCFKRPGGKKSTTLDAQSTKVVSESWRHPELTNR